MPVSRKLKSRLSSAGLHALLVLPKPMRRAATRALWRRQEMGRIGAADLLFVQHPKSGSTWMRVMLSRLYQAKYGLPEAAIPEIQRFHAVDARIPRIFLTHYDFINDRAGDGIGLSEKKIVFLSRHPCDVAVSLYFHVAKHARRDRKIFNNWPLDAERMSMFDFVMDAGSGVPEIVEFLNRWERGLSAMTNAMRIRYEDMRAQPVDRLMSVVAFIGAPFSRADVEEAVGYASFDKLKDMERRNAFNSRRLSPGDPGDSDSFKVRRGKVGGYRDYFKPDEIAALDGYLSARLSKGYGYSDPVVFSKGAMP
jgi:hypothetical protein